MVANVMWSDFTNLIFNNGCYACGSQLSRQESFVCLHCLTQLEETGFHTQATANELYMRFAGKVPIHGATGLFYFDKKGKIQKLIHALKYQDSPEIGNFLGKYLGETLTQSDFLSDIEAIIPVPLHPKKEIARGYNQSACIGEGISEKTNIPFRGDILQRAKKTETQALKTGFERWLNVADAFTLTAPPPRHILLIDDVITTGSTIEACIRALFSHPTPPQSLKVACVAIARAHN